MAEWSNAAVLKTVVPQGTGGSNPSLSAHKKTLLMFQKGEHWNHRNYRNYRNYRNDWNHRNHRNHHRYDRYYRNHGYDRYHGYIWDRLSYR